MTRPSHVVPAALLAVGLLAMPLRAAAHPSCNGAADDASIAACSRAIASGALAGDDLTTARASLADALVERGAIRYHRGDLDLAIADYDQAIRLDSTDADTFKNRGSAYQAKGDLGRAIRDYEQAVRLDPRSEGFRRYLEAARRANGGAPPSAGEELRRR
jgi:tetratricopeptide (TPR) repeat protein